MNTRGRRAPSTLNPVQRTQVARSIEARVGGALDSLGTASTFNVPEGGDAAADEVVLGSDSRLVPSPPPALAALEDVDLTGLADGDLLHWNQATGKWERITAAVGGGTHALDDLTNVNVAAKADGNLLAWHAATGKWIPAAGGGGTWGSITGTLADQLDLAAALAAAANVQADWTAVGTPAAILNKPALGSAASRNVPAAGNAAANEVVLGSDSRLSASASGPTVNVNTPTYKMLVTAVSTFGTGATRRVKATIATTHARLDGADIRVYAGDAGGTKSGYPLPCQVLAIAPGSSYQLTWLDEFGANATKYYVVTYGDAQSLFPVFTQAQFNPLVNSSVQDVGGVSVYRDDTQARRFAAGEWNTGTKVFGPGDDIRMAYTTPAPYLWKGVSCTVLNLTSNGGVYLGNPPTGGTGGTDRPPVGPDSFCFAGGDGYVNFVNVLNEANGFTLQGDYDSPYGQSNQHKVKLSFTYVTGGKWVFTVTDATAWSQNPFMAYVYVGTTQVAFSMPQGSLADPTKQAAIVIEAGAVTATTGAEVAL